MAPTCHSQIVNSLSGSFAFQHHDMGKVKKTSLPSLCDFIQFNSSIPHHACLGAPLHHRYLRCHQRTVKSLVRLLSYPYTVMNGRNCLLTYIYDLQSSSVLLPLDPPRRQQEPIFTLHPPTLYIPPALVMLPLGHPFVQLLSVGV